MKIKNLFFSVLFLISINSYAQSDKQQITSGKIIFDISYPESQFDEKTMANLPSESVMLFKGDKVRVDVSMPMGKTTVISDNSNGTGTMLMNMMGNKWAININRDEMLKQKDQEGKTKVVVTNETKSIAGFKCKKAIVSIMVKNEEKSFDAWFTKELKIKNSFSSQIEGIDGFLMEFVSSQNGMSMKMTARSLESMSVSDSEFVIPEGYQVKTMDELKNMGKGSK